MESVTLKRYTAIKVVATQDRYGRVVPLRFPLWRPTTKAEQEAWYSSEKAQGLTDDGETKLAPLSTYRDPEPGEVLRVVRARVAARQGYATISGCAQVEDASGVLWYILRAHIAPATP